MATAGADGEIVVHTWDNGALSLKQVAHRRIHKGAITKMVALSPSRVATIADDGCLYHSELVGDGVTFRLIHRATLPLRLLTALGWADGRALLAVHGDELKVELISEDGIRVASQSMPRPVAGLHLVDSSTLVSGGDGRLSISYLPIDCGGG